VLSGRVIEELQESGRELDGQDEKRNSIDFALWKKADDSHIMRWPSPWSVGFPGWHLECSVMSTKYLGERFDIHGGGMDLLFPHHECEIAQNVGRSGEEPCNYWMHNNMITLNGQKMGKSLGNAINLSQFFSGEHELLDRGYPPMTIRFFILQSHYRSTLDFSNEALDASEKGLARLLNAVQVLNKMEYPAGKGPESGSEDDAILKWCDQAIDHLCDDLNTAEAIARMFDLSRKINSLAEGKIPMDSISEAAFLQMKKTVNEVVFDILGLRDDQAGGDTALLDGVMELVLDIRKEARTKKDYATSDLIRDKLQALNIVIKDGKEGSSWGMN
jgi:cysteinyl-tRNA synthetase